MKQNQWHIDFVNIFNWRSYTYGDEKEFLISYGEDSKINIWDLTQFDPDYKMYVEKRVEQIKNKFFKRQRDEDEASYAKRTSFDFSSNYFNNRKQNIIDSIAQTKRRGQAKISSLYMGICKSKNWYRVVKSNCIYG